MLVPKFEEASKEGGDGVCADPGSSGCAAHLGGIMALVDELRTTVLDGGIEQRYPRTMDQVWKMGPAWRDYESSGCKKSADAMVDGSSCFTDAATILAGAPIIGMSLKTDEIRWELDG